MTRYLTEAKGVATPIGPYSLAAVSGATVYVAGQVALDEGGDLVGKDDTAAQTTAALFNVRRILLASGLTVADIAYVNVFLSPAADYGEMNRAYAEFFGAGSEFPPRATVITPLVRPEFLVEFTAIATRHLDGG